MPLHRGNVRYRLLRLRHNDKGKIQIVFLVHGYEDGKLCIKDMIYKTKQKLLKAIEIIMEWGNDIDESREKSI